ncbi:MAG: alpha-(1-_3)-arabinofuranosyltransferase family protein [Acidimicrobiia bacterium]
MSARATVTAPAASEPGTRPERRRSLGAHGILAILAFAPLLLTRPGRVASDTRQYFYTDPWKFLSRAGSLWDPNVHLGTVTHSNVGNLFPMGTFFALTHTVGIPAWTAQRLWIGLLLFAAGTGVLAFARTIGWRGVGPLVAALVYMLTPYTLQYAPRTSVLLLPYAALPWLIALTDRALRSGGWRHPAALALVALTISGANPSTFLMVVPGPVLWIAFALGRREIAWRDVGRVVWRTALLTAGTCALWIAALVVEGKYGLNVLVYTETLPQVSVASTAMEMLRGLGYWLFYGTEARDPNVKAAIDYLERTPFVLLSYAIPLLAVVAGLATRWRHRAFAIALVLTGVVLGVGAYPSGDSSPFGTVFEAVTETGSGLALRSSTRAVPLTVLGIALLLGAGASAVAAHSRRIGTVALVGLGVLAVANLPALFTGGFVDENFSRPQAIPQFWRDAATALDGDPQSRVLELPGSQFAAYRWGMTYDTPILPTLLDDRPSAAREQTPYGAAAAVDLLGALDRRLQEGTFEVAALAPIARFLGVGDVLVRSDLEYERYLSARPANVWQALGGKVPGLGAVEAFGPSTRNEPDPRIPLLDPVTLGVPADAETPPALAVRPVEDPQPIIRSAPAESPVIVAGDGEGLVDAAAAGLVSGNELVLSGPWLATHPTELARVLRNAADLVVTDTNRRRDRRWRSLRYTTGLTDRPGSSQPGTGQGEAELEQFPGSTDADRTVTIPEGGTVDATEYGGLVTFDPDQRAAAAFDDDPTTAWQVSDITDPVGQVLTVRLPDPVRTDHVELLQSQGPARTRIVSEVTLRFDGGDPVTVALDERSRTGTGQRIDFPARSFRELAVEITGVATTPEIATRGASRTGFAEVRIPGVQVRELIRVPTRLTRRLRGRSLDHRLAYVLTRSRSDPADTQDDRRDEEAALLRRFDVPDARSFTLTGTARVSGRASEAAVDALLGTAASGPAGVTLTSSDHLAGAIGQRAWAALDGDPTTAWTGDFLAPAPSWLQVDLSAPRTVDHLDLAVVADGRHSVPTQLRISAGGESRVVDLPPIADAATPGAVTTIPVTFTPLTGSSLRVEVTGVRTVDTVDTLSGLGLPLPPSIAELGLPGVVAAAPAATIDTGCRTDLLTMDGRPVAVQVTGDAAAARDGLAVTACDGALALSAGTHRLEAARGTATGIDLDRLTLTSDAGGTAAPLTAAGTPVPTERPPAPRVRVTDTGMTTASARVAGHHRGFWLVLGQSYNDGWTATANGRSLGDPVLVDGYANGWWVPAGSAPLAIELRWTPQRTLWIALGLSILAAAACCVLAVRGRRWPGPRPADAPVLRPLREPRAAQVPGIVVLTTAAGVAAAALFLVGPVAALVAAAVGAVAVGWRYGRLLLAGVVVALLAVSFLQVARVQRDEQRPVRYDWARGYETEHRLAMTALVLLAADPAVAAVRRRRRADDDPQPPAGADAR